MAELAVSKTEAAKPRPAFSQRRREALTGYLFAAPWIFGFIVLTLGPMIFSLYASFTVYDISSPPKWIGLDNYRFIFQHDPSFFVSLRNTIWYVVFKTPVIILLLAFPGNHDEPEGAGAEGISHDLLHADRHHRRGRHFSVGLDSQSPRPAQ